MLSLRCVYVLLAFALQTGVDFPGRCEIDISWREWLQDSGGSLGTDRRQLQEVLLSKDISSIRANPRRLLREEKAHGGS